MPHFDQLLCLLSLPIESNPFDDLILIDIFCSLNAVGLSTVLDGRGTGVDSLILTISTELEEQLFLYAYSGLL